MVLLLRRRPLLFATASVWVAATAASAVGAFVPAFAGGRVTGDEPHYLITAISLAEDGDLDVADEISERRYKPFHDADLAPQGRLQSDGSRVEPHEPLLPLLLAGPVAAGGWLGVKLFLAALAGGVAALTLWTAVRRFGAPVATATPLVLLFAISAPLAIYGTQVYPELPAALLVTAGAAALAGPFRRAGMLAVATSVIALPWLATKYAPVAVALAAIGLVRLARRGERVGALALGSAFLGAAGLFLWAHRELYGGFTAYATSKSLGDRELGAFGSSPDLSARSDRLIALFVDQAYGLAAWQPGWLLALVAVGFLLRRRPPSWETLALPLVLGWLGATFAAATMRGWWWPGRQLVFVLPLAVVAAAIWVGPSPRRLAAIAVAGALGFFTYVWTLAEGLSGRLTWVGDRSTDNPWFGAWQSALPDYVDPTPLSRALHWSWAVLALGLVAWGFAAAQRGPRSQAIVRSTTRVLSRFRY